MTTQSPTQPPPRFPEPVHCGNCGSQRYDPTDDCWHCRDAHRELLMRLDRGGDRAQSWIVTMSQAMHGVREKPKARWRIG